VGGAERQLAWEDAEGTFDTFDGIDTTLVDDGVFTLSALGTAEAGYNPLRVAQEAAFSGLGMLYETRTGSIGYADAARRADNADAGYAPVPAASLSTDGVQVASSLSDITNRVTVEFDGGVVTVTDDDSLQEFGLFQTEFATQLVNQSNAELWADRYVGNHSLPVFRADQFRLTLQGLGTALTDSLLVVEPNDALEFTGLPTALGLGATFEGFVEGWSGRSIRSARMWACSFRMRSCRWVASGSAGWTVRSPGVQSVLRLLGRMWKGRWSDG
jgi:hypothetical protein